MFRQYDSDNTVWSPQGRLYQIEYAMAAVKKGSACVALTSATHAVLVSLNRSPHKLAGYQEKVFEIDEHVGIAISGLSSDARMLSKFMRTECLNHRYTFESSMPAKRLATLVADKSQVHTQRYGRRPYGVGLLIAAYDKTGPHVFENCPSGNFLEYKAMAIGARSQACKTYLEKTFEEFEKCSRDELVKHGVQALREAVSSKGDEVFSAECVSVGVVGEGENFHVLDKEATQAVVDSLEALQRMETEGDEEGDEEDEKPTTMDT